MTDVERAAAVRGKTIRMTWTAGPTKGSTHEHVFHEDGTVEWHAPGTQKSSAGGQAAEVKEKPDYAAVRVADDIYAVSYLAGSGYTLTVVLNFREKTIVGFASSSNDWHPVQGTFQVVR
jgi:hypothetical protein